MRNTVGITRPAEGSEHRSNPCDPRLITKEHCDDRDGDTSLLPPFSTNRKNESFCYKQKRKMRSTALRSILRTRAPRRLASTSSSPRSAENAASTAQKKAQDALGAASALAMRAGTYARSALGPLGTRFSGLLGCPSFAFPCSLTPLTDVPYFSFLHVVAVGGGDGVVGCSIPATGKIQLSRCT